MLLTITTTHQPATDLGYLLHKNPAKLHSFELSFGKAHVFYPEAATESCTAALLLDVDPVALVRGRRGQHDGGTLDQYVNDRPYVLSSFLSVAMGRAFGTAMSGRSKGRPELAICSGLRVEVSEPSVRLLSGSLLSDSRRWSDLCTRNRCGEFTSASLVSWRWKANQLTRDCKALTWE